MLVSVQEPTPDLITLTAPAPLSPIRGAKRVRQQCCSRQAERAGLIHRAVGDRAGVGEVQRRRCRRHRAFPSRRDRVEPTVNRRSVVPLVLLLLTVAAPVNCSVPPSRTRLDAAGPERPMPLPKP